MILELKFYARGSGLVYDPTRPRRQGQMPGYVGRKFDPKTRQWRATDEPHCIKLDMQTQDGQRSAQRIAHRLVRRDSSLWPADEATAKYCGVPFPDLELKRGEWVESSKPGKDDRAAAPAAKAKAKAKAKQLAAAHAAEYARKEPASGKGGGN